jgi:hypothetical protein
VVRDAEDHNEGSEKTYTRPEVTPLRLVVETTDAEVAGRSRRFHRARVS